MNAMDIRKSISSVLGRDKETDQDEGPSDGAAPSEHGSDTRRSLVLRRQARDEHDKILIRLDPEVPRDESVRTLLSQGIVIDVLKISPADESHSAQVSLAIGAPDAFLIDRLERYVAPRGPQEVFSESRPRVDDLSAEQLSSLTLTELEALIADAGQTVCDLEAEQRMLKTDRKKAVAQGINIVSHDQYPHYLALVDECDALTKQVRVAENGRQKLLRARKQVKISNDRAAQEEWSRRFTRTAKEVLSKESYDAVVLASRKSP